MSVQRLAIAAAVIAFAVEIFWPGRREITNGWSVSHGRLFFLTLMSGLIPLLPWSFSQWHPLVKRSFDLVGQNVVLSVGIATIAACLFLTLAHVPGWWWTWNTIAMHAGVMCLAVIVLKERCQPWQAACIALAIFAVTAALWEVPYHAGYAFFYPEDLWDHGQPLSPWAYTMGQVVGLALQYLGGMGTLLVFHLYWAQMRWTRLTSLLLAGYLLCMAYWYLSGFWVDIRWDHVAQVWYRTQDDNFATMAAYRTSKVFLGLAAVSLYWKDAASAVRLVPTTPSKVLAIKQ